MSLYWHTNETQTRQIEALCCLVTKLEAKVLGLESRIALIAIQ